MDKVNLNSKFAALDEVWVPKIVAELNGQYLKIVNFEGSYVWHAHEREDEMFYVLAGRVDIWLRDPDGERAVELSPGEFLVVPRGVEHKPVSHGVSQVLLFEPATTRNTGALEHELTIEPERLQRA